MHAAWARYNTFFISHACKHACAHKIDDVKSTVQSSHVCTRRVHNGLQMHACLSEMHMPNLDYSYKL